MLQGEQAPKRLDLQVLQVQAQVKAGPKVMLHPVSPKQHYKEVVARIKLQRNEKMELQKGMY
jgi:hypothetical protein